MRKIWVVLGFLAAVVAIRACGQKAPEERLAGFGQAMCRIAERGAEAPVDGVGELFSLFAKRSPELLRDWGDLLVEIEAVKDDRAHDQRARHGRDVMFAPLEACSKDLGRFADAIERDPAASEKFDRGFERLVRTLSIFFDESEGALRFRPHELLRRLH